MKRECKYCGTTIEIESIEYDTDYLCPECNSLVYRRGQPFTYVFLISLTSLILYLWTLPLPLITIKIAGMERSTSLISAMGMLIERGDYLTFAILSLSVVVIPYIMLVLIFTVILAVRFKAISPTVFKLISLYKEIKAWNMSEVYLVGIFIAIIKLKEMSDLTVNSGVLVFVLFLLSFYIAVEWFNPDDVLYFCDKYRCEQASNFFFEGELSENGKL